ncbi:MAG TPA: restriction endonuclease [Ktedonobacteraceae bacterium]
MSLPTSTPPLHPDIKRELKQQLLALPPRSFEFFAGDFLIYVGLEAVSVTQYSGDGGIDGFGEFVAGQFRIPIGVQMKRYRHNVRRPDIDTFISALSRRELSARCFPVGLFFTTANYSPGALREAATSIPRILTINGDQIVSVMVEHQLGLKPSLLNTSRLDIDSDYFAAFEARKGLLGGLVRETLPDSSNTSAHPGANTSPDEQTIDLRPEQDLISLNALGYALRIDPARVRRWMENGILQPDAIQTSGGRCSYYVRRDRIASIRAQQRLQNTPASSDEWKQAFFDFVKSRNLVKSYKPVMLKAFFKLVDREGKVQIADLVREFRAYYIERVEAGQPLEPGQSLMAYPAEANDQDVRNLIEDNPLERFEIQGFIRSSEEGVLQIAPQLWQALLHYEVQDVLASADEQIRYYLARQKEKK